MNTIRNLLLLAANISAHTVEICYSVDGQDVTFYAGTYHSENYVIGGVSVAGNRYDFTDIVADDNQHPAGNLNVTCSACSTYTSNGINHWQKVTVQNVANGLSTVVPTTDTVVEWPWCIFPDLLIEIPDTDSDGINDSIDNCPWVYNPSQEDSDFDGVGDACEVCVGNDILGDSDFDGICDDLDVCFGNDTLGDSDFDGICDDLDPCFGNNTFGDIDLDGICEDLDVCHIIDGHAHSSENLYKGVAPVYDAWCQASCNQPTLVKMCPTNFCACQNESSHNVREKGAIIDDQLWCSSGDYSANPGTTATDTWCSVNCQHASHFCPETLCRCGV